ALSPEPLGRGPRRILSAGSPMDSCILWPATPITTAAVLCVSSLHTKLLKNNLAKRRPAHSSSTTPWQPSKGAPYRIFQKSQRTSRRRVGTASSFFEFTNLQFEGRSGRPAQAFSNPSTSLTTSSASLLVRHQRAGSNASSCDARTIARPRPPANLLQSALTRRVCALVVTIITVEPL